jgi:sulfite exporter TauE/SafE
MYGAIMAAAGGAYSLTALAAGVEPGTGVTMIFLGLVLAALGWLVSAPKRFTREIPKPATDIARAEQAIRINKTIVVVSNAVMAAALLGLGFGTPRGLAPDTAPILAMMAVWAPLAGVGMLRTRRLLMERGPRYERWLQGR